LWSADIGNSNVSDAGIASRVVYTIVENQSDTFCINVKISKVNDTNITNTLVYTITEDKIAAYSIDISVFEIMVDKPC
jgi:hypothetical protein